MRRSSASGLGYVDWEMTPLHVAAAANLAGAAAVLLELGADPAARTASGLTPLAVARQHRHEAVLAVLASPGAAPEVSAAVAAGDPDDEAYFFAIVMNVSLNPSGSVIENVRMPQPSCGS